MWIGYALEVSIQLSKKLFCNIHIRDYWKLFEFALYYSQITLGSDICCLLWLVFYRSHRNKHMLIKAFKSRSFAAEVSRQRERSGVQTGGTVKESGPSSWYQEPEKVAVELGVGCLCQHTFRFCVWLTNGPVV